MTKDKRKPDENEEGFEPKILSAEEARALILVQEQRLKRIQFLSLGLWLLFLIVGGAIFRTFPVILGLFLGGLIVVLNFYWLSRLVRQAFQNQEKPSKAFFFKFGLKFILLLAIVAIVIYFTPVHPIAFLVGLSVSVFGIMAEGLVGLLKKYQ